MIDIRRLQASDDIGALVALSRAFFAEYEAHHQEFFRIDTLNDEDVDGYFSTFVDQDDRAAFIAVRDGEIVGYISVYVQEQSPYWSVKRVGHISGLMVRQDARREGIGTRLVERARDFFREQGVKYCTVYTAVANAQALAFYRNQGLEPLYSHLLGLA
jgi:ribosomal protein S18 acetylase RimI-like enzyme